MSFVFAVCTTISAFPVAGTPFLGDSWVIMGVAGMMALPFYARFMSQRLDVPLPLMRVMDTCSAVGSILLILNFLDLKYFHTGLSYHERSERMHGNLFLNQNPGGTPGLLVQAGLSSTLAFNIWYSVLFLRRAIEMRSWILRWGIALNFLVLLNDALFAVLLARYQFPLSFLGFSVEITFFTYMQIRETERSRVDLEDDLLEAAKDAELGAMVGQICHDLRNPLAILDGWLRRLMEKADPQDAKALGRMEAAVRRIETIVEDCLRFLRPESDHKLQLLPLHRCVENALQFTEHKRVNYGVEAVHLAIDPDLHVLATENRLIMVFVNLINNACEALESYEGQKWIRIEAERIGLDGPAAVRVTDAGAGIPAAAQKSLFVRKHTTKREGHGTGLGLRFVARVLQKCGGSIEYDSSAANTTFVLRLLTSDQPHAEIVRENHAA